MPKGQTLTATERMERSRATSRMAMARELMMAGILARLWPSYLTTPKIPNEEYPLLLCVESPAGRLIWRLSIDELAFFEDWISTQPRVDETPADRLPVLQSLAENGWEIGEV